MLVSLGYRLFGCIYIRNGVVHTFFRISCVTLKSIVINMKARLCVCIFVMFGICSCNVIDENYI